MSVHNGASGPAGRNRRRYFVTGASSGIGAAVAGLLYDRGDSLWLLAHSDERAQQLAQRFPRSQIVVGDLANPWGLEASLRTADLPGLLDCLLLVAGVIGFGRVAELSMQQISEQVNTNLVGPMILTRALLPALRRRRGLVLIANSTAVLTGGGLGRSAYVASKAGAQGFADVLRLEESRHGVRVSTIFVGRTDTPMQERVHQHENKVYDPSRLLRPNSVARSILHVADLPVDTTMNELTIRPIPQDELAEPQRMAQLEVTQMG